MCWPFGWRRKEIAAKPLWGDIDALVRQHLDAWEVQMYADNPHLYCIPRLRRDAEERRYREELSRRYGQV